MRQALGEGVAGELGVADQVEVEDLLDRGGVKTLFIEPGSPWENGSNESPTGRCATSA